MPVRKKTAKKSVKAVAKAAVKKSAKKTAKKSATLVIEKTTKPSTASKVSKASSKPSSGTKTLSVTKKSAAAGAAAADWRPAKLDELRKLIVAAAPGITEERKWKKPSNPDGVALWSLHGMIATGEKYKGYVKVTFAYGASLPDPKGLFNAGLNGGTRRAIDLREGESVAPAAFKALVKAAVARNLEKRS